MTGLASRRPRAHPSLSLPKPSSAHHAAALNAAAGPSGRRRGGDSRARGAARAKNAVQRALEEAGAVRRTVYICDIDQCVTEAELAVAFAGCGAIVDCRVCGDPNSAMRFAFIEFRDPAAVPAALAKTGTVLGAYPLRVAPSKTAIVPVNRAFLPESATERALCARTVYAANIDRRVAAPDVRAFFEGLCGPVSRLRLLGDGGHATRIAFVEFGAAASAAAALNCSGALLGSLPIRVSPSKTPLRDDAPARRGGGKGVALEPAALPASVPPPAAPANGPVAEPAPAPAPADAAPAEAGEGGEAAPAAAPAAAHPKPPVHPAPPTAASASATTPGVESSASAATPDGPATPSGGG